jgi:nucleoside-diphosphate-sugar epimerase
MRIMVTGGNGFIGSPPENVMNKFKEVFLNE